MLNQAQLGYMENEGLPNGAITIESLLSELSIQVHKSKLQLEQTSPDSLLETRTVGRKKIPSNVLGLLFHAAEHMQRHTGQVIVTARIVRTKQV